MAEPPPYAAERNSMKTYRNYKEYPQKGKGISFSAFLLSIFIYISIFYVFDLSPSSLFNNTKFWFLISNTLILIIAADYGAFSSSKQRQDYLHEEYMVHNTSALPVQEVENSEKKKVVYKKSKFIPDDNTYTSKQREHLYEEYVLHTTSIVLPVQEVKHSEGKKVVSQKSETIPENKLEIVMIKSDSEKPSKNIQEAITIKTALEEVHVEDENKKKNEAKCCSETKQHEASYIVEENDEFSSMSVEELNRRVEEFIQKFNRQIRLQRAENYE